MNTKKFIYKALALVALPICGLLTTSCDGFLEITPMNQVVLQNFWTKKSDVTSVLMGCYGSLESKDNVIRMGVWGEVRSDNIRLGRSVPYDLEQVINENMLPTNSYCKWSSFYQTINQCNILCHYAPGVEEIDPNYTKDELKANIAEAVAIRSLCYFYLARTFRDVPFSRQASIDDSQNYQLPATPMVQLLDSLRTDLEQVMEDAPRRYYDYGYSEYHNSSRVTRYFIYSLLADICLWQGDYQACSDYCDKVIEYKQQQYTDMVSRFSKDATDHIELYGKWPLIKENIGDANAGGNAYSELFGESISKENDRRTMNGNSFESIFELDITGDNDYVFGYYTVTGSNMGMGYFSVPTEFSAGLPSQDNAYFASTDLRAYENIDATNENDHLIRKFVMSKITGIDKTKTISNFSQITGQKRTNNRANWIIYRLTDVMLMKAEALVEMGDFTGAFNLVNAVNSRANNVKFTENLTGGKLVAADYTTLEQMRSLVLSERHRELMFEGKRWFDLVRMARREGNTKNLATIAVVKQKTDQNAVKIRLADPNIIYYPYFREELKVNRQLKQNPAYNKGIDEDVTTN